MRFIEIIFKDPIIILIFFVIVAMTIGLFLGVIFLRFILRQIYHDSKFYQIRKIQRCNHKFEYVCKKCGYKQRGQE